MTTLQFLLPTAMRTVQASTSCIIHGSEHWNINTDVDT